MTVARQVMSAHFKVMSA